MSHGSFNPPIQAFSVSNCAKRRTVCNVCVVTTFSFSFFLSFLIQRFKKAEVKDIIHSVLMEELGGKIYDDKDCDAWCTSIVNEIQNRVTSESSELLFCVAEPLPAYRLCLYFIAF